MGLLTDPSGLRGRPFQFLVKNHGGICAFLYLLSIVWYCLLAHDQINAGTYLSENALLPGLVSLDSDVSRDVIHYVELLEAVLKKEPDSLPTAWIRGTFTQMGIESYVHNFTLNHPLNRGQRYEGKNVYGIIRGGGSSNEAIVLSVPFRGNDSPYPSTKVSIALLLAIAHYFRKQKYWAKDIVLLVTQHELLGTQAWLEAYHGTSCGSKGVLEAGELSARGGSIQAALNLEIHSSRIERLEVKLLGLNGQLPNLDLVNLVHRICAKERVKHSFAGKEKIHSLSTKEQWLYSLGTMTSMVLGQATGIPDGNHGLFHRFGIEAVTVESEERVGAGGHGVPMRSVGRVVEGVFRSINNLLERFHQSYFFYILADTDKFISIALYIICIGAQAAPLLIKAFADQVSLRSLSDQKPPDYSYNVGGVFLGILYCFVLGLMAFHVPVFCANLLKEIFSTRAAVLTGFIALSVFGILLIEIFGQLSGPREWALLKISALIHAATMLLAVSMSNFSLAFINGILIVPMVLLVCSGSSSWWRTVICLLFHPLVLASFFTGLSQLRLTGELDISALPSALSEAVALAALDSLVYGSATLVNTAFAYTPLWHMCFIISRAKQITTKTKKE